MKVRLHTIYAGPRGVFAAGKVIDLPANEARDLVKRGFAEPITGGTRVVEVEAAIAAPTDDARSETAQVKPQRKKRTRRRG